VGGAKKHNVQEHNVLSTYINRNNWQFQAISRLTLLCFWRFEKYYDYFTDLQKLKILQLTSGLHLHIDISTFFIIYHVAAFA